MRMRRTAVDQHQPGITRISPAEIMDGGQPRTSMVCSEHGVAIAFLNHSGAPSGIARDMAPAYVCRKRSGERYFLRSSPARSSAARSAGCFSADRGVSGRRIPRPIARHLRRRTDFTGMGFASTKSTLWSSSMRASMVRAASRHPRAPPRTSGETQA